MPHDTATDHRFMGLALDACRAGVEAGQSPFGACIVREGHVLATAHNRVWQTTDPSAHAEVECIRAACHAVGSLHLEGATIYTTTEPCPMCFTCSHWAGIGRIVFGARVEDAHRFGFGELPITNRTLKDLAHSPIELTSDFRRDEAIALFELWRQRGGQAY